MNIAETQEEKWHFDIEFLGLRMSSHGFGIDFITLFFKGDYRSLLSFEVYFKQVWTLDILFYKFIKT